ncbi:MAG: response regulator transcription factor [Magnetococcales bacterium]|nr:response regulator transcription factor [Magnetococcales bacterium]
MRILVIEDDLTLQRLLKRKLEEVGFVVDCTASGIEGEEMGREPFYQAVVLDLGLPDLPGLQLLKKWRGARIRLPVIILTARNTWQERVQGIEAGADDYLGKPFHPEELVARLRALIHRAQAVVPGLLQAGGLLLDENSQCVAGPSGKSVQLTATEFKLLRTFMMFPNKVFTKEALMDAIYDFDTVNDHNVIEVYVNHLRKKLGREVIRTLRLQGYVMGQGEVA